MKLKIAAPTLALVLAVAGVAMAATDYRAIQLAALSQAHGQIQALDTAADPVSAAGVRVAADEPVAAGHYDPQEYERQKAILAPKEGDYTRLYVFGALGVVLVVLLVVFAINRKKWQGPA